MELAENIKERINTGFFTPKEVTEVFAANFLDDEVCRRWILNRLHPFGAFCPKCGAQILGEISRRFWDDKVVTCPECGKQFTARTGTVLAGSHLSYREFILLGVLLAYGFSNQQISGILCCDPETVRLWRKKFQENG